MPSSVTFDGLTEAERDMQRWADQLAGDIAQHAEGFGDSTASQVRDVVPTLTGALGSSVISIESETGVDVGYDGTVDYDAWIEFGGVRGREIIPDGRYLYPTAAEAEPDFVEFASDAASDSIERFSWTTRH